MKITKYTVKNNQYEFECIWCGNPVYSGETAFQVDDCSIRGHSLRYNVGDNLFCSLDCNSQELESVKTHKIESAKKTYQKREAKYWWSPEKT